MNIRTRYAVVERPFDYTVEDVFGYGGLVLSSPSCARAQMEATRMNDEWTEELEIDRAFAERLAFVAENTSQPTLWVKQLVRDRELPLAVAA